MINAAQYHKTETLKSGTEVKLRSIRPEDKGRLTEAFENLEPESIYLRFFYNKRTLTDEDLKAATEVDFENVVALVVTTGEGQQETIIGVGRYVAFDDSSELRRAEVAFTVEEDYHRQGIAAFLLHHLAAIARQKGISRFEAEVLPENKGMLAVFSRSGLPMKQEFEGNVAHVTLSLTGEVF